jgi:hypothetical protein
MIKKKLSDVNETIEVISVITLFSTTQYNTSCSPTE